MYSRMSNLWVANEDEILHVFCSVDKCTFENLNVRANFLWVFTYIMPKICLKSDLSVRSCHMLLILCSYEQVRGHIRKLFTWLAVKNWQGRTMYSLDFQVICTLFTFDPFLSLASTGSHCYTPLRMLIYGIIFMIYFTCYIQDKY